MDKLYYLCHMTTNAITRSTTSLNDGDVITSSEPDDEAADYEVDSSEDDDDDSDDEFNENEVSSEDKDDDEGNTEFDVSMNSDSESIDESLAGRVLCAWNRRKGPVESNFSIVGWALNVQSEVMDDVKKRMNGGHRDKIEAVIRKLYADREDDNIMKCIDIFWDEYKLFENKQGQFNVPHRWNVPDVAAGRSYFWHEK